jgi:serine/threonine-protein kinase HipA
MTKTSEDVEGLNIQLHGVDVAVVKHYAGGKNILTFNPAFITTSQHERLTFSLRQRRDPQYLHTPQIRTDKLSPVLSNLLPEGALRDVVSQALQCHTNNFI